MSSRRTSSTETSQFSQIAQWFQSKLKTLALFLLHLRRRSDFTVRCCQYRSTTIRCCTQAPVQKRHSFLRQRHQFRGATIAYCIKRVQAPQFAAQRSHNLLLRQSASSGGATIAAQVPVQKRHNSMPDTSLFGAQPNGFQQAPQPWPQPGFVANSSRSGFQQAPCRSTSTRVSIHYCTTKSQFGMTGGYWSWFLSAGNLRRRV